jgi:Fic family protein
LTQRATAFLSRLPEGLIEPAYWEKAYASLGNFETVLNIAAAHHGLLWAHPFFDGNGRVARLISYAMLRNALNTSGLWSVARGLARKADIYRSTLPLVIYDVATTSTAAAISPKKLSWNSLASSSISALTRSTSWKG